MSKSFKFKPKNKCEICKEVVVKQPAKTCIPCNNAMAIVTNMLNNVSHSAHLRYLKLLKTELSEELQRVEDKISATK